ncbi:Ig-like domain-containing protein [Psychroflexus tropicus]|uniref:Ig-like domain-containing protein n=1 Tax=Psychroflexus tropicus TaxID=197345 RepID=UPI0003A55F82|nr:Ig-like domain-containing protein [Psychroflexus tropicus]
MIHKLTNSIRWIGLAGLFAMVAISCEREVSDDAVLATFPNTAEVYTDNPVGLTDQFFESFNPAEGYNPEAFDTDDTEAYLGSSSIRLDIPAPNDPDGGFVGGVFSDRGEGRDLSGYDALTFWIKASRTAVFDEVGFGTTFTGERFATKRFGVPLSTQWRKIIIPIPDPSKLTQESGLFSFITGSESTGGVGFTIWIDEIKFESLGTLGQYRPAILDGDDITQEGFLEVPFQLSGLTQTVNSESGEDITVLASPSYFNFETSNSEVATINETGLVSVVGIGEVEITASIGNDVAAGSLTLNVDGGFNFAPGPTRPAEDVVSLFSDAYDDIPVSRYNSFFEPFQTTLGGVVQVGPESIIRYTDLNFVGIVFNDVTFPAEAVQPVNATGLTHLHLDINVQEELQPGDQIKLELTNYGATETVGSFTITTDDLVSDDWASFDIPLSDFSGLTDRNRIGLLLFNSEVGANNPTISTIFLDNIYFYTE